MTDIYRFPCGCAFPIMEDNPPDGCVPLLDFDVENAPRDCPATWEMLARGLTKGIFQLESSLGRIQCKRLRPENDEHIGALGAILRPGSLHALDDDGISMTEHYCRRKNNEEQSSSFHPSLDSALARTYNVMCYQEQAMLIAQTVAGFTLQEADMLRKAIGKKLTKEMAKCKELFLEGARKAAVVSPAEAEVIFSWIEKSQRYSFNKSHAIAYGMTGYDTAFIKCHFPIAFFTAWLKNAKHDQDPKQEIYELVSEAKLFDIAVEPPDLLSLQADFHTDRKVVKFGLGDIKSLSEKQVEKMREVVAGATTHLGKDLAKFTWLETLVFVAENLSATAVTNLIQAGALRWLGLARKRLLHEYEVWSQLSDGERRWVRLAMDVLAGRVSGEVLTQRLATSEDSDQARADKTALFLLTTGVPAITTLAEALRALTRPRYIKPKKKSDPQPVGPLGGCHSEPQRIKALGLLHHLENSPTPLVDSPHWVSYVEEELFGISLTCHQVDSCDLSDVNCSCKDFLAGRTGLLMLGVTIDSVRELKTKKGKNPGATMAFLSVSDHSAALGDVVCFADVYQADRGLLREGNTVILKGERDRERGSLIVKKVFQAERS